MLPHRYPPRTANHEKTTLTKFVFFGYIIPVHQFRLWVVSATYVDLMSESFGRGCSLCFWYTVMIAGVNDEVASYDVSLLAEAPEHSLCCGFAPPFVD
jgi:hypothetical protein